MTDRLGDRLSEVVARLDDWFGAGARILACSPHWRWAVRVDCCVQLLDRSAATCRRRVWRLDGDEDYSR